MKIVVLKEFVLSEIPDSLPVHFFLIGRCSVQQPPIAGRNLRIPQKPVGMSVEEYTSVSGTLFWIRGIGQNVVSVDDVQTEPGVFTTVARLPTVTSCDQEILRAEMDFMDQCCLPGTVKWFHHLRSIHFKNFCMNRGEVGVLHHFDTTKECRIYRDLIAENRSA